MGHPARVIVLLLVLGAPVGAGAAPSAFRSGPHVLDRIPAVPHLPLGSASVEQVLAGAWPGDLLQSLREHLGKGAAVLLVGRTDPVGPRSLNRSLALQYAAAAARRFARELGADLSRFACASEGEEGTGEPGIVAVAWSGPVASPSVTRVTLLEPVGAGAARGRLWGFWDPGGTQTLWAVSDAGGETVWEADPGRILVSVAWPPKGAQSALGVVFGEEAPQVARSDQPQAPEEPRLSLQLEGREAWVGHLAGRLPAGWTDAVVWAEGIPYPVAPGQDGRFEADVVLMPSMGRAHLQVSDRWGQLVVGPSLPLPGGEGDPPDLLAVLVWERGQTDLDLHGWSGDRHTDPQDPDAAFSRTAVPGARLLFDGDGGQPASALEARAVGTLDLEAHCYSDLGGDGTQAWVYAVEYPGDPLRERRRVLGPRRLSGRAVEVRWPIRSWKGE